MYHYCKAKRILNEDESFWMYEHCMKLKNKTSLSSVIHKRYKNNNPTPAHVHFTKWRQCMRAITCTLPCEVHARYHASWHACNLCMRSLHAPWHACAQCMLAIPCLLTCLQTVHARYYMHPDMPVRSACSLYHASWHDCNLCMRSLHATWHACA